nr:putative integron gene cassette protein [uncultured bacterium]
MKKCIAIIVSVLLLASCADTHQVVRSGASSDVRLNETSTIYIAVPADGVYGANTYHGSGQNTAQIVNSAFAKRSRSTKVGRTPQSFAEARDTALSENWEFLVYPTILHWEDRATEWSAIPDTVEVKIEVVETETDSSIASAVIKGKSGLATFGGDHPQDLLPQPIDDFVSSLY